MYRGRQSQIRDVSRAASTVPDHSHHRGFGSLDPAASGESFPSVTILHFEWTCHSYQIIVWCPGKRPYISQSDT